MLPDSDVKSASAIAAAAAEKGEVGGKSSAGGGGGVAMSSSSKTPAKYSVRDNCRLGPSLEIIDAEVMAAVPLITFVRLLFGDGKSPFEIEFIASVAIPTTPASICAAAISSNLRFPHAAGLGSGNFPAWIMSSYVGALIEIPPATRGCARVVTALDEALLLANTNPCADSGAENNASLRIVAFAVVVNPCCCCDDGLAVAVALGGPRVVADTLRSLNIVIKPEAASDEYDLDIDDCATVTTGG